MTSNTAFWFLFSFCFSVSLACSQEAGLKQGDSMLKDAIALRKAGKSEEALERIQEALAARARDGAAADKKSAELLNRSGAIAFEAGDSQVAIRCCEESLRLLVTLGEDSSQLAGSVHFNLAIAASQRSAYSVSVEHFRQALAIKKAVLGLEHPETVSTISKLSRELSQIGQYVEALKLNEEAMNVQVKLHGEESIEAALILSDLCSLTVNLGGYANAKAIGERAIRIQKKLLPKDDESIADTSNAIGVSCSRLNLYDQAITHFMKSLSIYKKTRGSAHPRIGSVLINLGQVYRLQGKLELARETFQDSLDASSMHVDSMDPMISVSLNGIAETSFLLGDFPTAINACDKARRITKNNFVNVLPMLPPKEQLDFVDDQDTPRFNMIISACLMINGKAEIEETSASWVLNQKGMVQESLSKQNRLLGNQSDPKQTAMVVELNSARQKLSQLSLIRTEEFDKKKTQEQKGFLSKKIDALTSQIAIANVSLTEIGKTDAWLSLEDVRKAIDKDTCIIEFVRFHQYSFTEEEPWGPAKYVAWVIPSAGIDQVRLIDLGLAEPIDKLILEVRQDIAKSGSKEGSIQAEGEQKATAKLLTRLKKLRNKIYSPIAGHVSSTKNLLLSPDGSLWLAPWAALPVGDTETFLTEKVRLSFFVSASDLLKTEEKSIDRGAPIVVANPRFDLSPDNVWKSIRAVLRAEAPADRQRSFKPSGRRPYANVLPLPNTAIEAEFISPSLLAFTGKEPVRYLDQYALETIVKKVQQPSVLFFGTHGFFLSDNDNKANAAGKPVADDSRNPLARCGLLMSGCSDPNAGTATAGDDGVLTGMEIVGLNLQGTDLVILSACETAVGATRNGEGVASLSQAFHLAGAKCVLGTLWPVSDRESALLVNRFMQGLAKGESTSSALQSAQIERIQKHRERFGAAHPYFWAAHTVSGNLH